MNRPRRVAVVATAVLCTLAPFAVTPSPATAATASPLLGVFRGGGSASAVTAYSTWLGNPVKYALTYIARDWAAIDDPGGACNNWAGTGYTAIFSVPILPSTSYTLASGAAGSYDAHWRNFAKGLVANGCANATLRLGWEFNGLFFPWASGGKEAQFVAYWRRIVNQMRMVTGQKFKFDWCPLAGNTHANVPASYPGDSYVDFIGLDAYDNSPVHSSPQERWVNQVNRTYGLQWHADFAAAHGKPMAFAEWGLLRDTSGLGGGDNPFYISQMASWFAMHRVTYACYFEVDKGDSHHRLMLGEFPNAAAKFKQIFGG